jgi:hypothetical protein
MINEAGPDELGSSGRVSAGYAEYSRSSDFGVRFGVRFGPRDSKILAAKTA